MGYEVRSIGGDDPFNYGLLRQIGKSNAPTLVYLGAAIQDMLLDDVHSDLAYLLINAPQSWNVVSIDLPCHGAWSFPNAPAGLPGWRYLSDQGIDYMALVTNRVSRMLGNLVSAGITDPTKVTVAGVSRGGFAAMHCVQAGIINHVACVSPVVKLTSLSEFNGFVGEPLPLSSSALAASGFHLSISNIDDRVSTLVSAQFCADAIAQGGIIDTHITIPSDPADGHTRIPNAPQEAANWMLRRVGLPVI